MSAAILSATLIAVALLGPLKQIDAGVLNVGYAELGPSGGTPVVLLHGWPYDIHSYEEVAPLLAAKGFRVIVPYLRGYGTTRFISSNTFRNAQQSAVALDIIKLMDALGIERAIIGGFDWGSRTTDIIAALWPDRCIGIVAVSGYLITNASDFDGPLADGKAYASQYTGKHSHRVLKGIGHNVPQEAPAAFAQAIIDLDGASK